MKLLLAAALLVAASSLLAQTAPEEKVHPLVGTEHEGQTYPAAGVPFAMTHWTPQTRAGETKCIAPYYFSDSRIQGFRGTHFLSGSCVPDYGSMTVMASGAPLQTGAVERSSGFDRASEHASPYEYRVDLQDAGVRASITGTLRSGILRFQFQKNSPQGWMVVENNARGGDGWVRLDAARREVTGRIPVRREYAGSGKLAGFSGYFVLQFNRPVETGGTWTGNSTHPDRAEQAGDGMAPGVVNIPAERTPTGGASAAAVHQPAGGTRPGYGAYVTFGKVRQGDVVLVRIGTSFVSVDQARRNLRSEIPGWDYGAVREQARSRWHDALSQIELVGDSPAASIFYTALYHALLHPRTYSDVDGTYPRFASDGKVETAAGFTYYDDFSIWDTFRAQHPLLTLLDPHRDGEMMQSLVAKGEQGGFLPIFPAWNSYTSEMVGDHASILLIDAWRKGIRGFNADAAYRLMRKNATEIPSSREEYLDGRGRRGLDSYLKYGYLPLEDHIPDAFHRDEQVSRTLEYAYDDALLAQFAKLTGREADAALFSKRGENWRNVLNPKTGFACGRHADGTWDAACDPAKKQTWITEGLPWQYTFFVPGNIPGLIRLEGGKDAFVRKLDRLFAEGYYEHGNEPGHHIPYLYAMAGAPEKTQSRVRALMESEYRDAPGGLAGNDDAGQMSAWYVLSALGFYPVTPGLPEYCIGSPRFDEMRMHLPNGKTLHILAPGTESGRIYVRSITLNGKPVTGSVLLHRQLAEGGDLRFEMASAPASSRP